MATRNTVKALGEAFKLQDVRVESFIYITYTQIFLAWRFPLISYEKNDYWVNFFWTFPFSIFSKNWLTAWFDLSEISCVALMRISECSWLVFLSSWQPSRYLDFAKCSINIHLYFSSSFEASQTKEQSRMSKFIKSSVP